MQRFFQRNSKYLDEYRNAFSSLQFVPFDANNNIFSANTFFNVCHKEIGKEYLDKVIQEIRDHSLDNDMLVVKHNSDIGVYGYKANVVH